MGCCYFCVKYIMFIFNLIFALAGLVLLGLGIATQAKLDLSDIGLAQAPVGSIVLGSIIFIIAFLGCCGAIRSNNCMLISYSVIMSILTLLFLIMGILILVNVDAAKDQVPKYLSDTFDKNMNTFHEIEETLQCCGVVGPSSYVPNDLPPSCCKNEPCTFANAYIGCQIVMTDFLSGLMTFSGVFSILIAIGSLVAVLFSVSQVRKSKAEAAAA